MFFDAAGAYRHGRKRRQMTIVGEPQSLEGRAMMRKVPAHIADNIDADRRASAVDRRAFLASAGKASLALGAAAGLLGAGVRPAAAKTVTTMGFDHPYNFVTYVSDIQCWGTVYANAQRIVP